MCKIIMSINPQHVENILKRTKKFEFRTKVAKREIESIIVYCTFPTKKVIAEVKIKSIFVDTPEKLWQRTKHASGISKDFFMNYFNKREIAYAYELGEVIKYSQPMELIDFGCLNAPQSYAYVSISSKI